jgi:hypothetical protein
MTYGETFEVCNVFNRTSILFHVGNILQHTEGCILLGEHHGKLYSHERAVLNSGNTFNRFMELLNDINEFHISVIECF